MVIRRFLIIHEEEAIYILLGYRMAELGVPFITASKHVPKCL